MRCRTTSSSGRSGPLVGTRTWGALVGTLQIPATIDGGGITAPSLAFYDVNGKWAVENEGVAPDIEVENTPADVIAGRDPQLERAVQEALKLLEQQPNRGAATCADQSRLPTTPLTGKTRAPMTQRLRWLLAAPLLVASVAVVHMRGEQPGAQPALSASETMIAMRDGAASLHPGVCAERRRASRCRYLLLRTPYGIGDLNTASVAASLPELTAEGYIVVLQDIRGRFKSEGTFVMLRQPRDRKDTKAIDESTDTYDTIEWLLANVPGTTAASAWPARATAPGSRSWACSIRIRLSRPSCRRRLLRTCGSATTSITTARFD